MRGQRKAIPLQGPGPLLKREHQADSGLWPDFGAQPLYVRQRNLPTKALAMRICDQGARHQGKF